MTCLITYRSICLFIECLIHPIKLINPLCFMDIHIWRNGPFGSQEISFLVNWKFFEHYGRQFCMDCILNPRSTMRLYWQQKRKQRMLYGMQADIYSHKQPDRFKWAMHLQDALQCRGEDIATIEKLQWHLGTKKKTKSIKNVCFTCQN